MSVIVDFIKAHPSLLVITGAGISQPSGIPTYRDHRGNWQRSNPVYHQDFIDNAEARQRYWLRSAVGWPFVDKAMPNTAHRQLATLESRGFVELLVTQNVDRLHQSAGHQNVMDLHGRLDRVRCLDCQQYESRKDLQARLLALNPWLNSLTADIAPDGDAFMEELWVDKLEPPPCLNCGGTLMPDVVFYGGAVPKTRVQRVINSLASCDALLVIGSSLMVYSAYRFCKMAKQQAKPIAAINQGVTRADDLFDMKIEQDCIKALAESVDELSRQGVSRHE